MRKIAIFILFAMCFKFSMIYSQDSISVKKNRKFLYGFNVSGSVSHYVGANLNFSAVITTNSKYMHSLYFGPMLNSPGNGDDWGLQGGYVFFPNPKQKYFHFYFFYDTKYVRYGKYLGGTITPPPIIVERSYWQHAVGYGFHFNIISNLYTNSNIGVGITNQKTKNSLGISNQYNDPSWVFTVGIGYNF